MNDIKELIKEDFFHFSPEKIKEVKLELFKESFRHHFENCPEYKKYCEIFGVKPDDIKNFEGLIKIQPVPADAFRDSEKLVVSVPEKKIVKILTTSSTTSSRPVRYAMDQETLNGMITINGALWKAGHGFDLNNLGSVFFLAPKPSESETGLVNGGYLSFKNIGFKEEDITFCVENGTIDAEKIIEKMKEAEKPVNTYGPPFAYIPLISYLKEKPPMFIELGGKSIFITTGGWKGVKHDVSREEMNKQLAELFGINENQIRDGYGSTDILTMLPECEHHRKHVPPWNHISVRDSEDTTKEVADGEEGLIVLMASWIHSYPAYCMTGDMGYVRKEQCPCGRTGQTVEITGRAKGAGSRGCAIRLEKFMDVISKK